LNCEVISGICQFSTIYLKVAVTNAWLLYRRQYDQLFPGDKKFMSLLDFQIEIAYGLTVAGKMPHQLAKERGKPFLCEPEKKRSKTSAAVALPSKDVRLDGFGHFPSYDKKQHRCRYCTNGRTHIMCLKWVTVARYLEHHQGRVGFHILRVFWRRKKPIFFHNF
ncbi:hypothetical protein Anas_14297, partial [Armadillidium nasatum]